MQPNKNYNDNQSKQLPQNIVYSQQDNRIKHIQQQIHHPNIIPINKLKTQHHLLIPNQRQKKLASSQIFNHNNNFGLNTFPAFNVNNAKNNERNPKNSSIQTMKKQINFFDKKAGNNSFNKGQFTAKKGQFKVPARFQNAPRRDPNMAQSLIVSGQTTPESSSIFDLYANKKTQKNYQFKYSNNPLTMENTKSYRPQVYKIEQNNKQQNITQQYRPQQYKTEQQKIQQYKSYQYKPEKYNKYDSNNKSISQQVQNTYSYDNASMQKKLYDNEQKLFKKQPKYGVYQINDMNKDKDKTYKDNKFQNNTYKDTLYKDNSTYKDTMYKDNTYKDTMYKDNTYKDTMYKEKTSYSTYTNYNPINNTNYNPINNTNYNPINNTNYNPINNTNYNPINDTNYNPIANTNYNPTYNQPSSSFTKKTSKNYTQQIPTNFKKSDFRIGKKMGKGQFGEVMLVQHKKTGFICAMKIMQKKVIRQQKYENQIIRELSIQLYLAHRNIAPLYGYFYDDDAIYLLVQFCPDGQLLQKLRKANRMEESDVSVIIKQICQGVDYIHKELIIHRDIKPENILFNHGIVKISDFGWAVFRGKGLRQTTSGSPLYYSPEIVMGVKYDEKIDIWDIGMMTYECLLGKIPFRIYSEFDLNRIVEDEIKFPEYVDTTQEARDFILKTMRKKPQDRLEIKQMLKHPFITKYADKRLEASVLEDFKMVLK